MSRVDAETEILWREAEQSVARRSRGTVESRRVLLERLSVKAPDASPAANWARVQLALEVVDEDPWQAALLARKALHFTQEDDAAWGVLGLACSYLGHFRAAIRAYEKAVSRAPFHPRYAHNLGHLYDVINDDPARAVPLLRRATAGFERPRDDDVLRPERRAWAEATASLAHAEWRSGRWDEALATLRPVMRTSLATRGHHQLHRAILDEREACLGQQTHAKPASPRRVRRRRRIEFP
ncbi:MAG: hypothetical protein AAGA56_01630 [Myxococcota bacterium]